MKRGSVAAGLIVALLSANGAALAQTTTSTPTADAHPLTREVRPEQEAGLDLFTLALRLPQDLMELAFVPLMPIALAFERWQLLDRAFDLLTNEDQTMAFLPLFVPFNASGNGYGATFIYNEPLGSADRLIVVGLVRENGDRNLSISFGRRLAFLSGRTVSVSAGYSVDHDLRYFGAGPKTRMEDQRLLRVDAVDAAFSYTLLAPAQYPEYTAGVGAAFRRRRVGTGMGATSTGLTANDVVAVPAGFGRTLDYPEVLIETEYDSRDSIGRTTRGFVARLSATASHDVNGGSTGGVRIDGSYALFLPLLPLFRVLYISVAGAGTAPLGNDSTVPLHTLVTLGGGSRLRGYPTGRFLGRLGWWATMEWRYRFYEYADSTIGLSSVLFADIGQVGEEPEDLWVTPIPWSVGFALRAEQNLINLGRVQIAYSPEGFRFSVGVGEVF